MLVAHSRIGAVASAWAVFEQGLDDTLWVLAGTDHLYGACLTSQMGSSYNRLTSLNSLMLLRGVTRKLIDDLNTISSKWHGLNEKRNRIVHDPIIWDNDVGKVVVQRITSHKKTGLHYRREPFDEENCFAVREQMVSFLGEFMALRNKVFEETSLSAPT